MAKKLAIGVVPRKASSNEDDFLHLGGVIMKRRRSSLLLTEVNRNTYFLNAKGKGKHENIIQNFISRSYDDFLRSLLK